MVEHGYLPSAKSLTASAEPGVATPPTRPATWGAEMSITWRPT
jgi:hypothetical protein